MLQALYNCYKKHGELIAFIDLNKSHNNTITWEKLFQNIRCVSAYLNSLNLKKGFRAVIAIENSIEWIEIFFGVILSGGIAVPIDPKDSFENIEKKIHSIDGSVVFLNEEIVGKTKNLDNDIPGNIIIFGDGAYPPKYIRYEQIIGHNWDYMFNRDVSPNDEVCIFFSSGTTGVNKPVMLTLNSLTYAGKTEVLNHQQQTNDVFLCSAPFYHIGAFVHWLGSLFSMSKTVLYTVSTPQELFRIIQENHITITWLLLPWVQDIIEAIEIGDIYIADYELISWRLMHMGAQPIPETVVRKWKELFPNQQFDINYGLTESTGPGCVHLGVNTEYKPHLLGLPNEEWEIAIFKDGALIGSANVVGEILIRGPGIMKGYYNDIFSTRQVLSNEGWLFTGDMGYIDEDGYVFYTGRKKDIIIVGGENIYPLEIENHIKEIPCVKDVAVIGIPNNRLGEVVVAIVELSGENTEETMRKEIRRHCRSLSVYKQPVNFFFDTIPRNSTGKINKKQLFSKYASYGSDKIYE